MHSVIGIVNHMNQVFSVC